MTHDRKGAAASSPCVCSGEPIDWPALQTVLYRVTFANAAGFSNTCTSDLRQKLRVAAQNRGMGGVNVPERKVISCETRKSSFYSIPKSILMQADGQRGIDVKFHVNDGTLHAECERTPCLRFHGALADSTEMPDTPVLSGTTCVRRWPSVTRVPRSPCSASATGRWICSSNRSTRETHPAPLQRPQGVGFHGRWDPGSQAPRQFAAETSFAMAQRAGKRRVRGQHLQRSRHPVQQFRLIGRQTGRCTAQRFAPPVLREGRHAKQLSAAHPSAGTLASILSRGKVLKKVCLSTGSRSPANRILHTSMRRHRSRKPLRLSQLPMVFHAY